MEKIKELKDLKTFQHSYDCRTSKQKKGIGGGTGFIYFRVYKEGFQEILDFINQNYIPK